MQRSRIWLSIALLLTAACFNPEDPLVADEGSTGPLSTTGTAATSDSTETPRTETETSTAVDSTSGAAEETSLDGASTGDTDGTTGGVDPNAEPPGTIDLTFGFNGVANPGFVDPSVVVLGARVLGDGSVVAGAYSDQDAAYVSRFFANGNLDTDYGSNGLGFRSAPVGGDENRWFGFTVSPSGRATFSAQFGSSSTFNFDRGLILFNAAGEPDPDVGTSGWVSLGTGASQIASLGVPQAQPDERILLTDGGGGNRDILRRLATGTTDPDWASSANVFALEPNVYAVDASESVLAAGADWTVMRLRGTGTVDATWGVVDPDIGENAARIVIPDFDPLEVSDVLPTDDAVFVVGSVAPSAPVAFGSVAALAGLTLAGRPLTGFGMDGATVLLATETAQETRAGAGLVVDDGILVAGVTTETGTLSVFVAKFDRQGVLDGSFGTTGVSVQTIGSGTGRLLDMGIQPNGRLLTVVGNGSQVVLVRFWL